METYRKKVPTIPDTDPPEQSILDFRELRQRCALGEACPAEAAFLELKQEQQKRIQADEAMAVTVDRLADCIAKNSLAVERFERLQGEKIDQFEIRLQKIEHQIHKLTNIKWWIVGLVSGFEIVSKLIEFISR
jgi:hypothetical protein